MSSPREGEKGVRWKSIRKLYADEGRLRYQVFCGYHGRRR